MLARGLNPAASVHLRSLLDDEIIVGNLPYSATEADVENFFQHAGVTVDSVNVMRDRFTGEARGFGFVEIGNDGDANRAIDACNGRDLLGRAVIVNEARPMAPRAGGPGGERPRSAGGAGGNRRSAGGGGGRERWS
jgi:cold-inducible RNA-binding protein